MCFVNAALSAVKAKGLNCNELLMKIGLSPALLDLPQARVSSQQYGELWRLIALTLDDEFFGQDSRRMKSGSFAMICHAAVHSKTLRQALERALRFFGLLLDDIAAQLQVRGTEASIRITARMKRPNIFGQETLLVLVHGLACWLIGRRISISRAQFCYPEPDHSSEYRFMFSPQISFGASETVIYFDTAYLDLPVVQGNDSLKAFLRTAPEGILVKYKDACSLSARVRRRIRQRLPENLLEFEALAESMNMTAATLRRRLHSEGTSYQIIKDQLRRDMAIEYLSKSDFTTADIGLKLGFSERSAFHRAFKKWTGSAPGELRRCFTG